MGRITCVVSYRIVSYRTPSIDFRHSPKYSFFPHTFSLCFATEVILHRHNFLRPAYNLHGHANDNLTGTGVARSPDESPFLCEQGTDAGLSQPLLYFHIKNLSKKTPKQNKR